jgi:hypothetical protein
MFRKLLLIMCTFLLGFFFFPAAKQLRKLRFISVQGFRGFSPWSEVKLKYHGRRAWWTKPAHFVVTMNQRAREEGSSDKM